MANQRIAWVLKTQADCYITGRSRWNMRITDSFSEARLYGRASDATTSLNSLKGRRGWEHAELRVAAVEVLD
jgi:hypothetical protein